ncbi:sigma-70 family RNA polymerase sigma factor [Leucobacter sp. UT-8R-CII-1-4]|uniref:sigma-70 family RNA polymerase sigma factor n=1 Tax=Leucobacter sp. UT-8R-CII-1-4 TaxID=3040075 RepID=UPI0024A85E13|nr:sigma-70 family RNA polymerase sigma factor [Leucobacter sp. UT-8R-CII-1-4]MDI6022308.1 sigma-70 family RNA polymerase sigma factor [Leucobacter sp. UT-8R-CII-1-4]
MLLALAAVLSYGEIETSGEISDGVLCNAIREGEAWPLATLWERHYGIALAWARSKDPVNAEDAVSEAFDSVFRALLGGGGPTDSFRSYLFRAINTELSRTWKAEQRSSSIEGVDLADPTLPAAGDLASEREEQLAIAAALDDLPLRWKRVILEVDVGGRSVQEVAKELDLTPNSTSVLLKRAREGLKKSWLKRMHPPTGLNPECAACVADFSEVRWGKKNGRRRARAEEHLSGCAGCQSRWRRFVEQAAVIGMVSSGVLALGDGWRRKAAIASAAAAAAVLVVGASVAAPALLAGPKSEVSDLPVVGPQVTQQPNDGLAENNSGTESPESEGGESGEGTTGQPGRPDTNGSNSGGNAGSTGQAPGGPLSLGAPIGAEIPNSAHVNINDLDADGDGVPGTPTNEVWTRWGSLEAGKVNANDHASGLAGARFKLWMSQKPSDCLLDTDLTAVTAQDGSEFVVVSGKGGRISVAGLWIGDDESQGGQMTNGLTQRCYVLEEVAAPKGYLLPSGDQAKTEVIVRSVVDENAAVPLIPNQPEPSSWLSNTGQAAPMFILAGIALAAIAIGAALFGRKKRRN